MTNSTKRTTLRGTTALVVALTMAMATIPLPSVGAVAIPIDLNTFQQKGALANGNWAVTVDGTSVTQTLDGDPSYFVTPGDYRDTRIRGSVTTPVGDDDFFGWSVQHKNPSSTGNTHRTIIIDWKQADQVHLGYSAPAGFTIYQLDGVINPVGNNIWACFWGKVAADCPATLTVLATAHAPALGWEDATTYDWSVRLEENLIRLWIDGGTGPFVGGAIAIETAPAALEVENFGLYTFSQAGVEFHDLWLDDFIAPMITQTVTCATPGLAGWCLDEVTMSSTAVDYASGLDSLVCRTQSMDVDCTGFSETTERSTPYSYKTTARDLAGNEAVSFSSYKIDTELPEITATATCSGGADPLACDTDLTFAASATDSASGIDTLVCTLDAAPVPCAGAPAFAEGSHAFVVTATDKAGRSNSTSAAGILDFTPPEALAFADCWPWHMNTWCPVYATTEGFGFDAGSGIASLECFMDGSPVTCAETNRNVEGFHTFTVIATDKVGLTDSASVDWKTDHTKPTGSIISPGAGCSYFDDVLLECLFVATTASGPLTFEAAADDALSGVHSVEFWVDGFMQTSVAAPGPYTWTWDTSDASLGEHDVQVRVHDVAWNYLVMDMTILVLP